MTLEQKIMYNVLHFTYFMEKFQMSFFVAFAFNNSKSIDSGTFLRNFMASMKPMLTQQLEST